MTKEQLKQRCDAVFDGITRPTDAGQRLFDLLADLGLPGKPCVEDAAAKTVGERVAEEMVGEVSGNPAAFYVTPKHSADEFLHCWFEENHCKRDYRAARDTVRGWIAAAIDKAVADERFRCATVVKDWGSGSTCTCMIGDVCSRLASLIEKGE